MLNFFTLVSNTDHVINVKEVLVSILLLQDNRFIKVHGLFGYWLESSVFYKYMEPVFT